VIGNEMKLLRDRLLLFAILSIMVFYPLGLVGFTTSDDALLSIRVPLSGGIFAVGHAEAAALGRFMVLVSYPITQIPYLFDNQVWLFASRMFGFVFLFVSVFWAAVRVFRDAKFSLLILVLILTIMQNGWNHDLFTSYPLIFHFYAACYFSSVALFVLAIEGNSERKAWLAAVFYFFSMGTEVFVAFAFSFPLLALCLPCEVANGWIATFRARLRILLPMVAGLVVYLAIYVGWRKYYAMHFSYSGNSFDGASSVGFIKVLYYYGINGFPILSFQNVGSKFDDIFRQSNLLLALPLIKAMVASSLVLGFVRKPMLATLEIVFLRRSTAVMIISMFLVNLFLAFTSKYQAWVQNSGSRSFTYTFYSMVFAAIASALVLAMVSRSAFMQRVTVRRIVLASIGSLVFLVALVVSINNQYYFNDQALSNRKWRLFDAVIRSAEFQAIPDGAVIYSPSLPAHQRGIAQALGSYWEAYIRAKLGKDVEFRTDACVAGKPCYSLSFTQDIYRDEQYMVLAQVEPAARDVARELVFFAIPNIGGRILNGFFSDTGGRMPSLCLNNLIMLENSSDTMFSVRLPDEGGRISKISVKSDTPILLTQFIVSLAAQSLRVAPVQSRLAKGFYPGESAGSESWSWAGDVAALEVENLRSSPQHVLLSGELNSIHVEDSLTFSMESHVLGTNTVRSGGWSKFSIPLELPPGNTMLTIKANKTAIQPGPADTRFVSFRIRDVRVEIHRNGGQQ
jgi:hypothetical protein